MLYFKSHRKEATVGRISVCESAIDLYLKILSKKSFHEIQNYIEHLRGISVMVYETWL